MTRSFIVSAIFAVFFSGCVSSSKYDSVKKKLKAAKRRETQLKKSNEKLNLQKSDLETLVGQLERKLGRASDDQESLKTSIVQMKEALSEATQRKLETDKRMKNYMRLAQKLKSFTETGQLSVKIVEGRMVVALPGDVLFSSGSTSLSKAGKETVRKVGRVLKTLEERSFQVEGHTDNIPIKTSKFPTNWELAASRATTVVRELVAAGMVKERLSAASFSFYKPVASHDTAEGRELNRRIEIVVVPDMSALPGYDELNRLSDDRKQKNEEKQK